MIRSVGVIRKVGAGVQWVVRKERISKNKGDDDVVRK